MNAIIEMIDYLALSWRGGTEAVTVEGRVTITPTDDGVVWHRRGTPDRAVTVDAARELLDALSRELAKVVGEPLLPDGYYEMEAILDHLWDLELYANAPHGPMGPIAIQRNVTIAPVGGGRVVWLQRGCEPQSITVDEALKQLTEMDCVERQMQLAFRNRKKVRN